MDPLAPAQQKLGPLTAAQVEARAQYEAELQSHIDHAEAALQGDAVSVPDTIYSGLQEAGYYSADPVIDADPAIAAKARSLLQLVKEQSVSPSGDWELTLTDREVLAVTNGEWCVNCNSPQRFSPEEWEERMQKLEGRIGPRPADAAPDCNCPVCGFKLGIHGIVQPEKLTGPEAFTPEQRELVEEFFQGIYTVNDNLPGEG